MESGQSRTIVRVVVADDHALTRHELTQALEQSPHLAVIGQATNGEEALDLVRSLDPDVVVMDIRMPVLDGLAAARRIRAECQTKVVLISSFDAALYGEAAAEIGAAAYVSKSASDAVLVQAVLAAAVPATDVQAERGDSVNRRHVAAQDLEPGS